MLNIFFIEYVSPEILIKREKRGWYGVSLCFERVGAGKGEAYEMVF